MTALSQQYSGKIATLASAFAGTRQNDFTIEGLTADATVGGDYKTGYIANLVIKSNGDVELHGTIPTGADKWFVYLPPCLYVMMDFGD